MKKKALRNLSEIDKSSNKSEHSDLVKPVFEALGIGGVLFKLLKNERFSIVFSATIIVVSTGSLLYDFFVLNEMYWFQRSGALLVLAGVELQYSKITALWKKAAERERAIESVESRIESGKGIKMSELAEESERTRAFALRIHDTLTGKSAKEIVAVVFIITGTIVWAYGDIPFRTNA